MTRAWPLCLLLFILHVRICSLCTLHKQYCSSQLYWRHSTAEKTSCMLRNRSAYPPWDTCRHWLRCRVPVTACQEPGNALLQQVDGHLLYEKCCLLNSRLQSLAKWRSGHRHQQCEGLQQSRASSAVPCCIRGCQQQTCWTSAA